VKTAGRGLIRNYDSIIKESVDKLTLMQKKLLSNAVLATQVTVYRILDIVEKIGQFLIAT
jgi:hypothetical protein